MRCEQYFYKLYGKDAAGIAFAPYRVCPIGAQSDHNLGKITGFAIDKGIYIAYCPNQNGTVELESLQFTKPVQWSVRDAVEKTGDWADYLRGATWAMNKAYELSIGICGVIEGTLPVGGLSSSAAVILAFIDALSRVNGIHLSPQEMINIAFDAEKNYVGINLGKLDQNCEVLSVKNHLLYLDCADSSYELIPANPAMKPYVIALFFSGLERCLTRSKYNQRVDELRSGVYALKTLSGADYGTYDETNARDVCFEVYQQYKDRLPVPWAKRCEHWYTEFQRVEEGAEAWRRGDIEKFGSLSFESGWSSINNWESGAPEQIKLYEIMRETEGIYGGRFSGAGFNGFCIALIDPAKAGYIQERVEREYLTAFHEMKGKYCFYLCESADGIMARNSVGSKK